MYKYYNFIIQLQYMTLIYSQDMFMLMMFFTIQLRGIESIICEIIHRHTKCWKHPFNKHLTTLNCTQ